MKTQPAPKTWIYVLIGAVPAVALIGLTIYVLSRAIADMGVEGGGRRSTEVCASRLKLVAQAQLLYAADHDERLVPEQTWVDATWSYAKVKRPKDPVDDSESVFRCPVVSSRREGGYGYALNKLLGGKELSGISDPERTPLVFDSKATERNASGTPEALFPAPEGRHDGGSANVAAFVSGRSAVLPTTFKGGPMPSPPPLSK